MSENVRSASNDNMVDQKWGKISFPIHAQIGIIDESKE